MAGQARIGIYAGSFDPAPNGHLDVITRGLSLVDRLIIAVGLHPSKQPIFGDEERVSLLQKMCDSELPAFTSRITIITFSGLTVEAAQENNATIFLRGLRDGTDFDYEMHLAGMNGTLAPDIQTVFLPASPQTRFISATHVRQIALMGGNIRPFVPHIVADHIEQKLQSL